MPPSQYYPSLARLVDASAIPGDFQALEDLAQNGIDFLLGKLFYKDLVADVSPDGTIRYYSLTLLAPELKLPLFGSGMNLVFFKGTSGLSEFPLVLDWRWRVAKYIRELENEGFSYLPEAFVDIFIELADIEDTEDFIGQILEAFLDDGNSDYVDFVTNLISLINDYDDGNPAVTTEITNIGNQLTTIKNEVIAIVTNSDYYSIGYLVKNFPDFSAIQTAIDSIKTSIDTLSDDYDIEINVMVDFVKAALGNLSDLDEKFERLANLFKTWFAGITKQDFYDLMVPAFSVELNGINAALEFPRNWLVPVIENPPMSGNFEEDPDPNKLAALEFLIGDLKYSTQTGFEFENQSAFSFDRAMIGKTGIILDFQNLKVDMSKSYNIPEATTDGRPEDFMGMYAESASVILPSKWFKNQNGTNAEIYGEDLLIGTGGLSGKLGLRALGGNGKFTTNLGSNSGFELGFYNFDITFKQNKVLSSNIKASMKIPKFVYPSGHPNAGQQVELEIDGHIHDDGDFNLTASTAPPYPIELPGVFTYNIRSLELGQEDGDFYIGTSGSIQFQGFLANTLKLKEIEVDKLRIYSDGTIEFEGGSISLVEPIVLPLGPVEITVSAIHYGSHQKEVAGVMRKFNYFGFDGGISVDPLGIDVRGDGVKFYYCTDDLPNKPSPYLHIQTLYLDLTIPASSPSAIIKGWLSIPEPGTSPEYAGGVSIQLPQAKIAGSADMKLQPRYPAFIVDASIEFPAPIPLGPVGIYGFRGLIGYRYVAEKEAVGLVSGVDSWYDYYKFPPRGISVTKFSGPDRSTGATNPFSIGAGASFGTSGDNGTILNIKAMILLSIPSLFMIDGRANILSPRLGLEDPGDPPFFAFIAFGDNSLELGFGADFKMPTSSGDILKLYADVQAGFFFNNSSNWYVNIGTRENPVTARVLTLMTITSFLMLSARGIEAGARGEFSFKRKYGPIKVAAWAYIEVGGKISFEKPQFGAFLAAGVGADIDIKIVSLYAAFDVLFGVEAPKPFLIYGEFRLCVKIKILFVFKFKFCGNLSVSWEFNSTVDRSPIDPMINPANASTVPEIVKGVNMLSHETFKLAYLGGNIPSNLPSSIQNTILPLDTYIDIKTEKGFLPNAVGSVIGGVSNPPEKYTEMVPPEKIIRGKEVRQVKHKYSIESIELKSWNPNSNTWVDYNPWEALYPGGSGISGLKWGQFQKVDGKYNTIRLLATNPFSYTEPGEPGWYVPEQYGMTAATIFCEGDVLVPKCADFLAKPVGQKYFNNTGNNLFYSNQVAFMLLPILPTDYAEISTAQNPFNFARSLEWKNSNTLQVRLPDPSAELRLWLTTFSFGVKIRYWASTLDDTNMQVTYGHPDPNAANQNDPYEVSYTAGQLANPVLYSNPNWRPITRIEIVPDFPNQALVASLQQQIADIQHNNNLIELGVIQGKQQDTNNLEAQLEALLSRGCTAWPSQQGPKDPLLCDLYQSLLAILPCFDESPQLPLSDLQTCAQQFYTLVANFFKTNFQTYTMPPEMVPYHQNVFSFYLNPNQGDVGLLNQSANTVAEMIGIMGNCIPQPDRCYTLLHQICWLSLEDYQYNLNIPSQAAIQADAQAAVDGITQFIQPVWRPDTSYVVRFTLKDEVDDGASTPGTYSYTYGFTTDGPVGYFHENANADYGDPAYPDEYALTSLKRYIDYQRSYPNADGNLINAKPLFYNDETTRIDLFFTKAWAKHFFHSWGAYNGLPAADGRLKIVIKDPKEGSSIVNPPYLDYDPNDTIYTNIPQTIENWQNDPNPVIPNGLQAYSNLINSQNCVVIGGNTIVPPAEYAEIIMKHLKPRKLYTAVVNNHYDTNNDGDLEQLSDIREVHRFTFQTSRYANFAEQINSYLLTDGTGVNQVTRPAIFSMPAALSSSEVTAAYDTIVGNANTLSDSIEVNFQHKFDRVLEGILGFAPLEAAMTTEFNLIRNTNDSSKIVAVLIRNPEPFNNPRMPLAEVADTISVLTGGGAPNNSYKMLYSKDYSQVLIMHSSLEITGPWDIRFQYKIWDGSAYVVPAPPDYSVAEIGTIELTGLDFSNY